MTEGLDPLDPLPFGSENTKVCVTGTLTICENVTSILEFIHRVGVKDDIIEEKLGDALKTDICDDEIARIL